jgi:hypothetical protein
VPTEEYGGGGGPLLTQQCECDQWDLGDEGGVAGRHGSDDEGPARTSYARSYCSGGDSH